MRTCVLVPFMFMLAGCIADNKTKQDHGGFKPEVTINVPPPPPIKVNKVDTDRLVDDTAARVSQTVKTDMAANQAQLSGHITGQIHKMPDSEIL